MCLRAQFDDDFVFEVGALVIGRSPDGEFRAKIHEIHDDHVVLDLNHPLAGTR